jgi:predicted dehydrogenase
MIWKEKGALMKWAIAGLGYMGKKFLHDTSKLDDTTVVAVASEHESRVNDQDFAFYRSYAEMFSEPNFDAVYISTTPNKHFDLLDMCLKSRIPALCEKPIFFNKSEIAKFKKVSSPSFIAENISFMFDTQVIELISALNRGLFGEISEVRINLRRKLNPLAQSRIMNRDISKGALHDIGVYGIHFLASIFDHLIVIQQKLNYEFENDYSGEVTFLANNLINCRLIYSIEHDTPNTILIMGSKIRIEVLDFLSQNLSINMCSDTSKILALSKKDVYYSNLARAVALTSKEISLSLPQSNFIPLSNSIRTAELIVEILDRSRY